MFVYLPGVAIKMCFKTSYIPELIKILFEFNRCFKLQNVVAGGLYSGRGRGAG